MPNGLDPCSPPLQVIRGQCGIKRLEMFMHNFPSMSCIRFFSQASAVAARFPNEAPCRNVFAAATHRGSLGPPWPRQQGATGQSLTLAHVSAHCS